MLRAGPFSDERVVRLANRCFVPFYFDLSPRGVAGDKEALDFVAAQRKELAGSAVPTPPVLFMNATGEVLGEVSNYAPVEKVLAAMLAVLEKYPEYCNTPKDGIELDPVKRADWLIDLHDYDGARAALADVKSEEGLYLKGHLARLEGDWDAMEKALAQVKSEELADDVRMERAYRSWFAKDFDKLEQQLAGFPKKSHRFSESRYYTGLAHFHKGEKEKAIEIWKTTVEGCSEDPWIYRSDWAYYNCKAPKKQRFVAGGGKDSLLGRIGYMGRANPDLAGPGS